MRIERNIKQLEFFSFSLIFIFFAHDVGDDNENKISDDDSSNDDEYEEMEVR